jgi:ABC-type multidrug transport system permease subunit
MGGTSLARRVYLWTAWLFLAAVVVQVFFIGLQLFAGAQKELHMGFGYLVLLLSLVVVIAAFVAGLPSRSKRWAGALFGVTLLQVFLAGLAYSGPNPVAALHPVNALLVFWVTLTVLRDAQHQVRTSTASGDDRTEPATASAR